MCQLTVLCGKQKLNGLHLHNFDFFETIDLENFIFNFNFKCNFGLVHADKMSTTNSSLIRVIETLAYMSPDMLNEEKYENKTDIYSYGVVFFILFT